MTRIINIKMTMRDMNTIVRIATATHLAPPARAAATPNNNELVAGNNRRPVDRSVISSSNLTEVVPNSVRQLHLRTAIL